MRETEQVGDHQEVFGVALVFDDFQFVFGAFDFLRRFLKTANGEAFVDDFLEGFIGA